MASCCPFRLSSSEWYPWLTPQWLHGTGLPGWAVSARARTCHCPEPSMAPTDPRDQPGALARGRLGAHRPEPLPGCGTRGKCVSTLGLSFLACEMEKMRSASEAGPALRDGSGHGTFGAKARKVPGKPVP